MKTVVFVDELLLVNFVVSAALLLCAGLLCGRACTGLRLCAGSGAAALFTLVLLAPTWPVPLAFLYKIGTCCAVVAAVYGLPGVRGFAQLCAWYVALNFALCGAVVLPGVQANNLTLCLPVSPGRLLLCCGGVYGLLRGLLACFGRPRRGCFAAVLELSGVSVPVQAFHDTGFALQEPLTGGKVVLVQYAPVRAALPAALRAYLDGWFAGTAPTPPPELRVRFVPCATVAGHDLLPAVPAALRVGTARVPGLLAAFCAPPPSPAPWTLLLGDDVGDEVQNAPECPPPQNTFSVCFPFRRLYPLRHSYRRATSPFQGELWRCWKVCKAPLKEEQTEGYSVCRSIQLHFRYASIYNVRRSV